MLSLITTPILLLQMIKSSEAFTTKPTFVRSLSTIHRAGSDNDVQYGGNTWSPEAGKMQSTDVGDYFPEDFDQGEAQDMFDSGTKNMGGTKQADTERPGLEDLGQGGFVAGEGYKTPEGIPDGMEFLPTSNPDGKFQFNVASSGKAGSFGIDIEPFCMGFEDFYASFSPDSHQCFAVSPNSGRMDRRGGELSHFEVSANPQGASGELKGTLVVILPEENEKLCYEITATAQ